MQIHLITGNLTADATVRKDYISMTVAENIRKKDGSTTTEYHRVMYHAKEPAKLCAIFLKGRSVLVQAYDYTSDGYISEKDHTAHADTTFWATRVDIIGYPKSEQPSSEMQQAVGNLQQHIATEPASDPFGDSADDMPF